MNIEVRLFATFRQGREKKQILCVKEGTTICEILQILNIPQDEVALLLLNGFDGSVDRELKDSDVLSLFPPVGGG